MKKVLIILALLLALCNTANAKFVYHNPFPAQNDRCVLTAIQVLWGKDALQTELDLYDIYEKNKFAAWNSARTVVTYVWEKIDWVCVELHPVSVKALSDTKIDALAFVFYNKENGHLIAIKNGDYYDTLDTGDYVVTQAFVSLGDFIKLLDKKMVKSLYTPYEKSEATIYRERLWKNIWLLIRNIGKKAIDIAFDKHIGSKLKFLQYVGV